MTEATLPDFDVAIVGSGAAGVSAAFPLVEAGLKIAILDAGETAPSRLPTRIYADEREHEPNQWKWMVGDVGTADLSGLLSPKYRAPTHAHVFSRFNDEIGVSATNFMPVGSLAPGGLTAAWGAGVACFDEQDLADFPFELRDLEPHYARIAERIGVSGPESDDLDNHYGSLRPDMPPVAIDGAGLRLHETYRRRRQKLAGSGFALGRARLAALTRGRGERLACDNHGLCLWGCPRKSIYSAVQDLGVLVRDKRCKYLSRTLVEALEREGDGWLLACRETATGDRHSIRAKKVVLAAGVIASTRLALKVLKARHAVRLLSTPTSAFMLIQPRLLGARAISATALAQHWFTIAGAGREEDVCGGLFSISNLPMAEFLPHIPLNFRSGIDLMSAIHPALSAGNLFFHSAWSDHRLRLREDGGVHIKGKLVAGFDDVLRVAAQRVTRSFRELSAWTLPGSFALAPLGSDAHYAGTLPMRQMPEPGETSVDGELAGTSGLYVVDGSSLTSLPPKSHTLTIMANADRIAHRLASSFRR